MVSTLDSESSDPRSNLGRTWDFELSAKCAQCSTSPSNLLLQVLSLVRRFGQKRLLNDTTFLSTFKKLLKTQLALLAHSLLLNLIVVTFLHFFFFLCLFSISYVG